MRICGTMLLLALCLYTRAEHVVKIYIKFDPPADNHDLLSHPYSLVNPGDTVYIGFNYSGDMGIVSHHYYLKKDTLNGTYELYVNDRLASVRRFTDGKRDGTFRYYNADGQSSVEHFDKGKPYGAYKHYSANGRLHQLIFRDTATDLTLSTHYYEDGSVSANIFSMDGTKLGNESFNKNGMILSAQYPSRDSSQSFSVNRFNKRMYDGEVERVYETGRLELTYEQNTVVKMRYYDFEQQKYTCAYIADEE